MSGVASGYNRPEAVICLMAQELAYITVCLDGMAQLLDPERAVCHHEIAGSMRPCSTPL